MTLKWDQENVRLAIHPLWMILGWGRVKYLHYDKWKYCQVYVWRMKSKPRIIRLCLHSDTNILQNSVFWYIQNSNMECGTCKLHTFEWNRPMQINWASLNGYFSVYEHFSQVSNLNLVQIACKLTYIPYANNSCFKN